MTDGDTATSRLRQPSFHEENDDDVIRPIAAAVPEHEEGFESPIITRARSHSVLSASGDTRLPTPTTQRSASRDGTPVASRDDSRPRSRPRRYESPLLQQQQMLVNNMPLNFHRAERQVMYTNPTEGNNRAARRRRQRDEQFRAAAQRAAANSNEHEAVGNLSQSVSMISLGAGSTVGANNVVQRRIFEPIAIAEGESLPVLSTKQGPSRRKIRRWDNDRMVGIAAELARAGKNSDRSHRAAQEFARGQAEAVHFVQANHPLHYRSVFSSMTKHDCAPEFQKVKARYLAGEVATSRPMKTKSKAKKAAVFSDGTLMWNTQVPARLRKVVTRACESASHHKPNEPHAIPSGPSVIEIINALETFLVTQTVAEAPNSVSDIDATMKDARKAAETTLKHILTEPPSVKSNDTGPENEENSSNVKICLAFDSEHPKGGFYRLLAHAVAFFHGMKSYSNSNADNQDGGADSSVRTLTICGHCYGSQFRLVEYALASRD